MKHSFILGSGRPCQLCGDGSPIVTFSTDEYELILCRKCADEIGGVFPPPGLRRRFRKWVSGSTFIPREKVL